MSIRGDHLAQERKQGVGSRIVVVFHFRCALSQIGCGRNGEEGTNPTAGAFWVAACSPRDDIREGISCKCKCRNPDCERWALMGRTESVQTATDGERTRHAQADCRSSPVSWSPNALHHSRPGRGSRFTGMLHAIVICVTPTSAWIRNPSVETCSRRTACCVWQGKQNRIINC